MSFKVKSKTRNNTQHDITLQAKFLKKTEYFANKQHELINNNKRIRLLRRKYNKFNSDNTKLTNYELEEKLSLLDEIRELDNNNLIQNETDNIEYLLDTGDILFKYFDKNRPTTSVKKNKQKPIINTNKSVVEYFNNNINTEDDKESIFEQYQFKLEGKLSSTSKSLEMDVCYKCNIEKIIHMSQGKLICPSCGDEDFILIDSDKPSYKEPPREICYFAYKRINHFNEWLAQFQAKESTDIPTEIYDAILLELKKERVNNMENLNPLKVREILKKLKQNKYYEHVAHIINKINGNPPPIMDRKTEEELRRMFKKIQIPFYKHCPKNRKNFLSYSYVLHKFVQLLELDDFLDCFLLLKSREKLHQQDLIWKKICEELKWEFIPSV
jgi:hypothetical protein